MNELKILGEEHIGSIKFTGIEGGFGEGKKAMLVRDIAVIHESTIKRINELINRNKKWFKNGIDLIDLKQVVPNDLFSEYGFTKAQWGNANHVYLLSERGYAKLLKIMDDDKAWDIYDELVDNYFNMRASIEYREPTEFEKINQQIARDNALTAKGTAIYEIAKLTDDNETKQALLMQAASEITGKTFLPVMKKVFYSATQVGEQIGISANKVGRIANKIGIKAEQPGENQFGRWATNKAKHSSREIYQWLYSTDGVKAIKQNL